LDDGRVLLVETWNDFLAESAALTESADAPVFALRLCEGAAPKGTLGKLEGTAAKLDIVNRNRRFYGRTAMEKATERAQALIGQRVFLGEVDHPYWGSLKDAAFRFTKLWIEDDLLKFEGVILPTEAGQCLKGLIEGGVGVQVSTRGYASVEYEMRDISGIDVEVGVIGDDLTFEGIDFVLFASNPYGRVHTESARGAGSPTITEGIAPMKVEELREKHADVVASIESAARTGYIAAADVEKQVNEAKEAARTEGATAVQAQVQALESMVAAIAQAITPFVPALKQAQESAQESEADKTIRQLQEQVAALQADKQKAEEKAQQEAAERAKAEQKQAVTEKVDALLKDFTHGALIRDELLACESVEEAETAFEAKKTLIESLAARMGVEKAKGGAAGVAEGDDKAAHKDDTTPDAVAETIAVERRLAGLA
jgi:hypothetical protein